jgi:hypothetical protein
MVAHACDSSIQKAEAGGFLVEDQPGPAGLKLEKKKSPQTVSLSIEGLDSGVKVQ